MDRQEKRLEKKVDQAAEKLRSASVDTSKTDAECERLGAALAKAKSELRRYRLQHPPR